MIVRSAMPGIWKGICKKLGISTDVVTVGGPSGFITSKIIKENEMEKVNVKDFSRPHPLTGAKGRVTMRHDDAWQLLFDRQNELYDAILENKCVCVVDQPEVKDE